MASPATARPYANPYVAGVGLGLVLLASFVVAGRGLGATGAFGATAAGAVQAISPSAADASPYLSRYVQAADGPWHNWVLVEILGAMFGAYVSARFAGRVRREIARGPRMTAPARLAAATAGGAVMGLGAVLGRGCTSGQVLSGGALLSVGSWLFATAVFVGAYAAAPFFRRAWR
jgi:hypothetical protein